VKFILVSFFWSQTSWKLSHIGQVVTAFFVNAFMDAEAFAVFLSNKDIATIRASQFDGMFIDIIKVKAFFTDLTKELTF
jgi:hypothetical protein